jgi:tRNA (mo5U34)-methyltransferase
LVLAAFNILFLNPPTSLPASSFFDRRSFFQRVNATGHPGLNHWMIQLQRQCQQRFDGDDDAQWADYKSVLCRLPVAEGGFLDATGDVVKVVGDFVGRDLLAGGAGGGNSDECPETVRALLLKLLPWRVGPWRFAGVDVDAEWRSYLKWKRIASEIYFDGAKVLDVGCNNGYFGFKALDAGAEWVLGVEPTRLYAAQHEVFRQYLADPSTMGLMPICDDQIPLGLNVFDVVLSMGVLYHRKNPVGHLERLYSSLRKRGQLVLETMAIESQEANLIVPEGKFAKMRGIWFMPTVAMLQRWLRRIGFDQIQVIDISTTRDDEQRTTPFMPFESRSDFVDPQNAGLTIEGYPMPCRVVISALRGR